MVKLMRSEPKRLEEHLQLGGVPLLQKLQKLMGTHTDLLSRWIVNPSISQSL